MTRKAKIIGTALTVSGLTALAVVDAILTVDNSPLLALLETKPTIDTPDDTIVVASSSSSSMQPANSSSSAGGTAKAEGPDVDAVIANLALTTNPTRDPMFLPQVITDPQTTVRSLVILKDNDRAGLLSWTESPNVKVYFLALEKALHQSFTPNITDLIDETQRREGSPPRNFLSFLDTGISEERIAFARVRERLYEIHVSKGNDEVMFQLLDELTK